MAKRANRLREQGKKKRGRLWLKWEDCVRRDINNVGVFGEWIELGEDRRKRRNIMVKAGQKLGTNGPHP